jgi:hypothetical protein
MFRAYVAYHDPNLWSSSAWTVGALTPQNERIRGVSLLLCAHFIVLGNFTCIRSVPVQTGKRPDVGRERGQSGLHRRICWLHSQGCGSRPLVLYACGAVVSAHFLVRAHLTTLGYTACTCIA